MRRLLQATVLALLGAVILLIGPAAPAWACDCAPLSRGEALANADLAFTGVVVDVNPPAFPKSSADPVEVAFAVQSVLKGKAVDRVVVTTALESPSCGYHFQEGVRYEVYAQAGATGLCSGNRELGAAPEVPLDSDVPYVAIGIGVATLVLATVAVVVIIRLRRRPATPS